MQGNANFVRFDATKKNAKQAAARIQKPPRDGKQWKRTDNKRQQFGEAE